MEKLEPLCPACGNAHGAAIMEKRVEVPPKVESSITIWSSIHSGYMFKRTESRDSDICIPIFRTASFILGRRWKQPKCPPVDERINKMWSIHPREDYSPIQGRQICHMLLHGWTWRTICEVNKPVTKRQMPLWFHLYELPRTSRL